MLNSVLVSRALPLALSYLLLVVCTWSVDLVLHKAGLAWTGRYLGVAGALLVAISFSYSARKHKLTGHGILKHFLRFHSNAGWLGTLLILVHSGIHFNALLPWMATGLLMVVSASGHVGQYLVCRIRDEVKQKKKHYGIAGDRTDGLEQQYFWDSVTLGAFEKWRFIHMPLVTFLGVLTLVHLATITIFTNWR
ncbi:MAG: hypothetical protein HGA97_01850 [Chlorobiaceae bacterium]|nr:hypothetical protein [Chlorobiaceae bacterium]